MPSSKLRTTLALSRLRTTLALSVLAILPHLGYTADLSADPVFDLRAITSDPLDAKALKRESVDGVVVEHVEFTSDTGPDGKPIRTFGILAYPEGKTAVPGIVWGQSGMADAMDWAPKIFAQKGYACISITLPKEEWGVRGKFDTDDPRTGNLVKFAVTHMRSVTYLASRKEVDPDRIGIGGSSYGGLFATLVAGADPRIKAGMSFFGGGNLRLGTNIPQFNKLEALSEVEIFSRTGDGGWRHARIDVPFLWCAAANDRWFHLPAVVKTYEQSKSAGSRLCILPHWGHGFPPNIDQQLFDWFDIHLGKTRQPYNRPGAIELTVSKGKLYGKWSWTGTNEVKEAHVVVSYGRAIPWCGWVHRYHHPIPANIDLNTAKAEIPVPDPGMDIYVFGNILDSKGVLISTLPITATPSELGIKKRTGRPDMNCYPFGDFEEDDAKYLKSNAIAFGKPDTSEKKSGEQSIRMEPPKKQGGRHPKALMKLLNLYESDHKLTVWLKASEKTTVNVAVRGVPPQNWNMPAVKAIVDSMKNMPEWSPEQAAPSFTSAVTVGRKWKKYSIDCPFTGTPVEGYDLQIQQAKDGTATWWIDDVVFSPIWD